MSDTRKYGVGVGDPLCRNGLPQTILFLVGLPASGKSTVAKELVREDPTFKRVNKDDLRYMTHDEDHGKFDRRKEDYIVRLRDILIFAALDSGFNVVVDDTNIAPKHWDTINQNAEEWAKVNGKPVIVERRVLDTPLEECLARNARRSGRERVPEKVIRQMSKQLGQEYRVKPYRPFVEGLPEAIVFDMDGTTSLLGGRNPYDAKGCINDPANVPVLGLLHDLMHRYALIGVSGREDKDSAETEEWLRNHGVLFYDEERDGDNVRGVVAVHLRKTGDKRNDAIVKCEIYETHIFPHYNVKFVLDDRTRVVNALRDLGVPVFQVAWGDF